MSAIRVLIVDDQEIVRQGLATILRYAEGIAVVGQAADGEQAIAQAAATRPDVILLDLLMPRLAGVPALRIIKEQMPGVRVIILTTYDTDDLVFEGCKAGADGYLLKDVSSEALVEAIRGVMHGEAQIDPRVAGKVLGEFQRLMAATPAGAAHRPAAPAEADLAPLTEREEEVLRLLVQGLSNREIAQRLFLSEGTVKNYVSAILSKLQANDRTQAVITALRRGLADLGGGAG